MPSAQMGMILADFENLNRIVREDPALRHHTSLDILRANTYGIERAVIQKFPRCRIQWRITAFSATEFDSGREADYLAGVVQELAPLRYLVEVVEHRPDAADEAITEIAKEFLRNRRIKIIALATQDSGRTARKADSGLNFADFVRETKKRHTMHFIGLDYVPQSFQADEESCSLIRADVTQFLDQIPRTKMESITCLPREATVPPSTSRPIIYERVHRAIPRPAPILPTANMRDNAWRFFSKNPYDVTDMDQRKWIAEAFASMINFTADDWCGTSYELLRGIRSRWPGPAPPPAETLQEIIFVLERLFFTRKTTLSFRQSPAYKFLCRFPEIVP